jgi:hypothetical protein
MELKSAVITLKSNTPLPSRPDHLRGFIGSTFHNRTILHQHEEEGVAYRYPLVRYTVLNGAATILGYDKGAETMKEIYPLLTSVVMGHSTYKILERSIKVGFVEYGSTEKPHHYRFASPWLALSQENYAHFKASSETERWELLSRILVGNLISSSKGLSYTVPSRINAEFRHLHQVPCRLKGVPVTGFSGDFTVNFRIPDLFGLGKSVSRGFGLVKPLEEVE